MLAFGGLESLSLLLRWDVISFTKGDGGILGRVDDSADWLLLTMFVPNVCDLSWLNPVTLLNTVPVYYMIIPAQNCEYINLDKYMHTYPVQQSLTSICNQKPSNRANYQDQNQGPVRFEICTYPQCSYDAKECSYDANLTLEDW